MKRKKCRACGMLAALLIQILALCIHAQEAANKPEAQAVSQTGLLPIYGVDFAFDTAWVDGSQFPSKSSDYPNSGVNATFQRVWESLKSSGFNVIRFRVDVRDTQGGPNRVANLCLWARNNNVNLVPVLVGAERGQPLGVGFSANVSAFVKALSAILRSGGGLYLEAYSRILAYQLEDDMNHQGLHGAMSPESAQQRLGQATRQVRKTEQEALKDTGLNSTPLMVNVSFDYELIRARALAGASLSEDAYAKAYESLRQFLAEFAAEPDVDIIGVDWFAGSLSAGAADRFPMLLRSLMRDLAGKQIIFTTGFSTGFHSGEEQKHFYTIAFTNLADYRASQGVDSPFVGVFFREALNGKEPNPAPPRPDITSEIPKWDGPAKADELARMWSGEKSSDVMGWWLKKVENNMGLLELKLDGSNGTAVNAQAAQESLQQIATTVTEANSTATNDATAETNSVAVAETASSAAATPGTDASTNQPLAASDTASSGAPGSSELKNKAQQALMLLLDVVIDRLIKKAGGNSGDGNNNSSNSAGNSSGDTPPTNTAMPSIALAKEGVTFAPASPHKDEKVTFNVAVHNQSADLDASGLVVALVDNSTGVLAQATGISVGRNGAQNVPLDWTPGAEGNYSITVQVYDASASTQLANLQIDPLNIAAASATTTPPGANRIVTLPPQTTLPFGSPQIREFTIGMPGQAITMGQMSLVVLSLANPFARALMNVKARLLVDGKETQSRTIATLLPQQNRSVVFSDVPFAQAGVHEVKIILESGNQRRVAGSLAKRVQVGQKVITPAGSTKTVAVSVPIKPVRPVVSAISVGGIRVPVGTGGPATNDSSKSGSTKGVAPVKPEDTKGTRAVQPGGATVIGPKPAADPKTGGVRLNNSSISDNTRAVGPLKPAGPGSSRSGGSRVITTPQPEGARKNDSLRTGNSKAITPARPRSMQLPNGSGSAKVIPGKHSNTNSNSNRPAAASTGNANRGSNGNVNANANSNRPPKSSQNQNRPRVTIRNANRP